MVAILSEEIGRLIKNIERELLEFVKYVETIEEEYNKLLPPTGQTSGLLDQKQNPEYDKDLSNNNGIFDAIEIAKVMVQRIYNLLDDFSSAITVKEKDSSDYLEKYFYNQYVCQIVAYLLKILEENLGIFSGELIQSGERRDPVDLEKEGGKGPVRLRFAFFKPATLFTEDGQIYQASLSTRCRNGTQSEEDGKCDHYRCRECLEREKRKTLVLSNTLKSLDTLVSVVEKLLLQFRNFSDKQSSPLRRGAKDITPGKEADYVLKECIKFCESCKTLLKNSKYKTVQLYKDPAWHEAHQPHIHAEREDSCTQTDEKEDACPRTAGKGNLKEQDSISEAVSAERASSENNQSLKPELPHQERKEQSIEKRSDVLAGRLKPCVYNSEKKLPSCSKEEPKFSDLHRTRIHFSPPAGTSKRQEKVDSSHKEDTASYPQTVVFDVKKFSHLLKEKFKKTEGRSKSKELLDIVINSLKESSDFKYEAAERNGDRISHLEAKTATVDDIEVKADKAVDALVDNVIRVAARIVLSEADVSKKLRPQEKRIRAEEDEQSIDLHTDDSDELVKKFYPEQFELNKKFHNAAQACISCVNMKESITTELPTEREYSSRKVHEKKSLSGSCFHCFNACQRGLTIHQCHFNLPSGVLEIRHMDESARILVCFLKWDISKEPDDWRWQKNPFPDPTRVEIQQPATSELDPVLKVVYGLEGTMVKESFGETRLRTIRDFPQSLHDARMTETEYGKTAKSDSMSSFKGKKIMKKFGLRYKKPEIRDITGFEFHLFNKLSRFFDDIQKFGYGRGPPLILKLRKNDQLNDAYNLLMAPSKVRLHYYRNLRVLFVSQDNTRPIISKSNFVAEDESNELFDDFARKLFGTEAYHLFDYPSEEAHYMYLNPDTNTHPQWFAFAGTVLALAFLHQKKMDVKLSSCLFKCLLDRPLVIGDLQSIDPLLYQKLMWLKQNDLSSRKARMTFTIRDRVGGKTIDTELMVNGKNIAVTEKNKYRYIELAVKWKLAERCLTQLKDFRRGFASVVDPCFLSIFKENELLSIIKQPPEVLMPECLSTVKGVTRRGTW